MINADCMENKQILLNITAINLKGSRYLTIPLAVRKIATIHKTYIATFYINESTKEIEGIQLLPGKEEVPPTTPEEEKPGA